MDAISLLWTEVTGIGIAVVAVAGGLWKILDSHVKHWKDSYEAKVKELESAQAQLKLARDEVDNLRNKLWESAAGSAITSLSELPGGFTTLVTEYREAGRERDDNNRIEIKEKLANKLGGFAIGRQIPRHVLVGSLEPGCIVALAQIIIDQPQPGDAKLLATASELKVPPHARHQVMDAIEKVAGRQKLNQAERTELLNVLSRFDDELSKEKVAVDMHTNHIERARQAVQQAA